MQHIMSKQKKILKMGKTYQNMTKMMTPPTYKIAGEGVKRSDGAFIPNSESNRDWKQYQEWLADGHIPEPEFTPEEIIENEKKAEKDILKNELKADEIDMFAMFVEMWTALKILGAKNTDIDSKMLSKLSTWKTKLDRITEIDE